MQNYVYNPQKIRPMMQWFVPYNVRSVVNYRDQPFATSTAKDQRRASKGHQNGTGTEE
jgi:hypothetical protein